MKCEREQGVTEFQIATLELQWRSIYIVAGVGIAKCALMGFWIYIMHMASRRSKRRLANQAKTLDIPLIERTEDSARALRKLLEKTP